MARTIRNRKGTGRKTKDYAKSEKFFIRDTPDIYKKLRPHLPKAMAFAKKRGSYDPLDPKKGWLSFTSFLIF